MPNLKHEFLTAIYASNYQLSKDFSPSVQNFIFIAIVVFGNTMCTQVHVDTVEVLILQNSLQPIFVLLDLLETPNALSKLAGAGTIDQRRQKLNDAVRDLCLLPGITSMPLKIFSF